MLTIVIANTMQFTIVNELPRISGAAFLAISVENIGESPTTVIPQTKKKTSKSAGDPCISASGDTRQQAPETSNAIAAVGFSPNR